MEHFNQTCDESSDGEVYCELHFRWNDVDEECEECERDQLTRT